MSSWNRREEIGRFVLDKLKEYQEEYCVEITGAGIKGHYPSGRDKGKS